MLSELLFFFSIIFSLILRGNAHISKTFLIILLLGATLSTEIFHEHGPRSVIMDLFHVSRCKVKTSVVNGLWPVLCLTDIKPVGSLLWIVNTHSCDICEVKHTARVTRGSLSLSLIAGLKWSAVDWIRNWVWISCAEWAWGIMGTVWEKPQATKTTNNLQDSPFTMNTEQH